MKISKKVHYTIIFSLIIFVLIVAAFLFLKFGNSRICKDTLDIITDFKCILTVYDDKTEYECEFINTAKQGNNLKFLKPESLCGISFTQRENKFEAFYNGLKYETDKQILGENSIFSSLFKILNSVSETSEETGEKTFYQNKDFFVLKGIIDNEDYEVNINKSGYIESIFFKSKNIKADFKYV
ncbi:hypothetical protein FACS189465_3090 [Clostridia bacterium]|nr:hypothetical protein FACS189465_3090 [Clostridia bacterium]